MVIILENKELEAIKKIIGEKSVFNLKNKIDERKFTFKDYRCVTSRSGYVNVETDLSGAKIRISENLVDILCDELAEIASAAKGLMGLISLKSEKLTKYFTFD